MDRTRTSDRITWILHGARIDRAELTKHDVVRGLAGSGVDSHNGGRGRLGRCEASDQRNDHCGIGAVGEMAMTFHDVNVCIREGVGSPLGSFLD